MFIVSASMIVDFCWYMAHPVAMTARYIFRCVITFKRLRAIRSVACRLVARVPSGSLIMGNVGSSRTLCPYQLSVHDISLSFDEVGWNCVGALGLRCSVYLYSAP